MGSKVIPMLFICMLFLFISLPPILACAGCCPPGCCPCPAPTHPPHNCHLPPPTPRPHPPSAPRPHPPHHGGPPKVSPPSYQPPPVTTPPIISPPVVSPPVNPPPYPPYRGPPGPPSGGGGGGGGTPAPPPPPPPATQPKCPIDALKLGLCVDVLGGLVHIGIGDPIENVCCPVLKGLLELEAAICLCTIIRIKLLNLNIFLPLALQVLVTCGLTPPPGFVCPPLV